MPVSKKQREANRRNAQKSTGPRTLEGKERSRSNATTHGLTAVATIYKPVRHENPADFIELRNSLRADCKPVGTREELAVEMMASAYRRIQRCESWEAAYLDGGMETIQMRHGKPRVATSSDDLGCGIVLGAKEHELTWDNLDRYRRAAWLDYNRAQNQLRQLQKERLERPQKEYQAFIARQNYLKATRVASQARQQPPQPEATKATSPEMASFCPPPRNPDIL